jgi:hypothetical protein
MGGVMLSFAAMLTIITVRDVKEGSKWNVGGLPLPSQYLAATVVYGALGQLGKGGQDQARVANLLGWGLVVAAYLNYVSLPNLKVGKAAVTGASTTGTSGGPGSSESGRNTKG